MQRNLAVLLLAFCCGSTAALAGPIITIDYTFTINGAPGSFPNPKTFTGKLQYDLAAADINGSATVGVYPLVSHSITVDAITHAGSGPTANNCVSNNTSPPCSFLEVANNAGSSNDQFRAFSDFGFALGSVFIDDIGIRFLNSNTGFSGDGLFVPNPADFTSVSGILTYFDSTGPSPTAVHIGIGGNVTSMSIKVPEPASLALFGLGLAGLGWSRRRNA